ncbi:Wall-associated receptor kinase-like 9 [Tetrabaena socialis]|uniref:Wall-associated receptor kinase-like 9 n=1 Tax=Tetrabaena socialis TaxID=47790 RepID=A0A2J7ZU95_9CHLO|nr:Wall-associated receptor kinase-like 9 [Tetrabaena socialis]|eukprot:PNH03846.1 Wall-associated receptor kinase-like 9 [Tetrabaena socialis]
MPNREQWICLVTPTALSPNIYAARIRSHTHAPPEIPSGSLGTPLATHQEGFPCRPNTAHQRLGCRCPGSQQCVADAGNPVIPTLPSTHPPPAVGMAGSVLAGGAHRRLALRLAADIALGMAHVHSCRIVHGDLKPGFGSGEGSGSGPAGSSSAPASLQLTAKVADFGLSLPLEAGATHASRRFHGTPAYSAPEVLLEGRQSPHADVWSFGMMLLELFYGCTLSYMRGLHGTLMADAQRGSTGAAGVVGAAAAPKLENILTKEIFNSPYLSYGDLTASCLRVDPRTRPSFEELAKHLQEMLEDKNAADEKEK